MKSRIIGLVISTAVLASSVFAGEGVVTRTGEGVVTLTGEGVVTRIGEGVVTFFSAIFGS